MQYLQGWNVCICYVFLCGYILYMHIVRQFLVLQKRGLLCAYIQAMNEVLSVSALKCLLSVVIRLVV